MNLLKILAILGFACLFVLACSEKSPTKMGQAEQTDSEKGATTTGQIQQQETKIPSSVAASVPAGSSEIDGTVQQTEKGLAIVTDTDRYMVSGKDLTDMIGKTVKVTGVIAENGEGQVIEVMSVMPME
jgi:hypothetical protein